MLLTQNDITELARALDAARASAVEGTPLYCTAPRLDEKGCDHHIVQKRSGPLKLSHGVHGRAFLAIDPRTKEIRCAACAAKGE